MRRLLAALTALVIAPDPWPDSLSRLDLLDRGMTDLDYFLHVKAEFETRQVTA